MNITRTHNGYHLGDQLVHLHFLRKVALANPDRQFVHAAQWQYLKQLQDVIADVPNIKLEEFGYTTPSSSIDSWRGANQFWYQSEIRNDFVRFHIEEWFEYLAARMGVENPVTSARDMLFDYPAIKQEIPTHYARFDVLVINSPPSSGQFAGYSEFETTSLAWKISNRGFTVARTWHPERDAYAINPGKLTDTLDCKLSVTQIGHISLHCHTILMVSTGPSWPTFNIWNQESVRHRIILLEPERVNLSPNTVHCASVGEASEVLKEIGLL